MRKKHIRCNPASGTKNFYISESQTHPEVHASYVLQIATVEIRIKQESYI